MKKLAFFGVGFVLLVAANVADIQKQSPAAIEARQIEFIRDLKKNRTIEKGLALMEAEDKCRALERRNLNRDATRCWAEVDGTK